MQGWGFAEEASVHWDMLELLSGERQSVIPAGCDKYGPGKNEPTLPRVDMI